MGTNRFCVDEASKDYLITLEQKAGDLHGFIFVASGVKRTDAKRRFVALIRDHETGTHNLVSSPLCESFGLPVRACTDGPVNSQDLVYRVTYADDASAEHTEGIRVDVLAVEGMTPDELPKIAVPCLTTSSGQKVCGAQLGTCEKSARWLACRHKPAVSR